MTKFTSITIRKTTDADLHIPKFDNTKLTALDTCVRWGVITYSMHKVWPNVRKSQALDAGTALHEVFAAIRLWQLCYYDLKIEHDLTLPSVTITDNQGRRLFGKMRWDQQLRDLFFASNTRESLLTFVLEVLHTSAYEEDPTDKKRSFSALEEVAINYVNRWDMQKYPIWIRDINDPETDVGIEIGFDLVIEFTYPEKSYNGGMLLTQSYRFTGKLDGLHYDPQARNADLTQGAYFVEDNKTTGRIMSDYSHYEMDTQMRGYEIAAKAFADIIINNAAVKISSLPVPAKSDHGGQKIVRLDTPDYQLDRWFVWFYRLAQIEQQYQNNPKEAPVTPSSCLRYFKPCALLPYCTASDEEQDTAIEEMETSEWDVNAIEEE